MASGSSFSRTDNCPSVLVLKELMELVKDPKEGSPPPSLLAHLTTMDELLMHVKNYIVKHKLYDPANPLKILVHENELGSLLGKSEFSLLDVRDILLEKFVFPVAENSSEVTCSIRDKMSVSKKRVMGDASEFSAKRMKGDDKNYESDESMHSIQNYETDFVKDSNSDDSYSVNGLIIAETFDVDVEYEIETFDDSDFSCQSDSDIEDVVKSAIITFIASSSDSDIEYLADGSSDETQSEQELSEKDKWRCLSCLTLNEPLMRCCAMCWQTRFGWLSETSEKQKSASNTREGRRKAPTRSKRKHSKKSNRNKDISPSNCKLSDISRTGSSESFNSPSSSCNDNLEVFQSSSNAFKAGNDCSKSDKQLCLFCCAKPADSSIIHGRVGCKVCCFKCGQKLFAENKRCPVCRRHIERIVYLYNS